MFTLGGISGVMLAMIPFTIHVSDTYFIVAHIHYVLFGGSLFTIFAGVYYWFPKMTGRMYDETLGKLHFWLTFVFFNATFAPDAPRSASTGMPRRVADYAQQFAGWNLAISIASFILGASTLIFVYNMVASWRGGPRAAANPWRALTLEWQVSSPPPVFNFDAVPDRRRQPVRVRRARRGARHLQVAGRGRSRRARIATRPHARSDRLMATVLVVANETLGGRKLVDAVQARADEGRRDVRGHRAPEPARRPAT